MYGVPQRSSKTLHRHLHDVAVLQTDVIAKTETIRTKEVHMNIARSAVGLKLEMMVFDISEAMAHLGLARPKRLAPLDLAVALDRRADRDRLKLWIDAQFGPQRTVAQF